VKNPSSGKKRVLNEDV